MVSFHSTNDIPIAVSILHNVEHPFQYWTDVLHCGKSHLCCNLSKLETSSSYFADVNECSQDGICGNDQMCINTEGSFFCFQAPCKSGYKRVNGTCQGLCVFALRGRLKIEGNLNPMARSLGSLIP